MPLYVHEIDAVADAFMDAVERLAKRDRRPFVLSAALACLARRLEPAEGQLALRLAADQAGRTAPDPETDPARKQQQEIAPST